MRATYLAAALIISGCAATPTTQISAFGNSTNAIISKVDSVLDEYNNVALDRQFTSFAAIYRGDDAKKLKSEDLATIYAPITPEQRKNFAMFLANKALGAYSKALSDLASAGNMSDVDLAAANLYGSVSSINDQYKTLKDTQENLFDMNKLAGFSSLIITVGDAIVEKKRGEAIKGIVIEADANVSLLCDTINKQLGTSGIDDVMAESRQGILSEELVSYHAAAKSMSLDERRSEIKRLYFLQQEIFNSKLLVQQAQKAVIAVKNAHAALAKELKEGRFISASITSTIGRLKSLETHYNDFQTLLLTCKKIAKNEKTGVLSCDGNQ